MKTATVSLLDKSGNVQYGLNWGQREHRDPDQSYLQLTPEIYRGDYFPPKGKYFIVETDDDETLIMTRAQKDLGCALQTPENNAILGKYIRKRLGVESGAEITLEDILNYGISDIYFYKEDELHYKMSFLGSMSFKPKKSKEEGCKNRQQIFYGAPGTGKSHTIKEETEGEDVVRTTFHPDTDYSTFVGAYKPTTIEEVRTTVIGTRAVPVENPDGSVCTQTKIVYDFVMQSFLQAYVNAWKKYAVQTLEQAEPARQFLIIEEINRGNCAQIFGDLFQLLDRNEYGFSEYPINADADMQRQLAKAFDGLSIGMADDINAIYNGKDIVGQVLRGEILLLPNNLYVWATMNTSDQSLFPIDSAFKRRWDWKYMPISNANKGWTIEANGNSYDWWTFVDKINKEIDGTTHSEDKKLGYFFCKADNGVINAERFVGKVIFYIWNDVFKDYDFENQIFYNGEKKIAFHEFYTADGNNSKVVEPMVANFLANLGVMPLNGDDAEDEEDSETDISQE